MFKLCLKLIVLKCNDKILTFLDDKHCGEDEVLVILMPGKEGSGTPFWFTSF
jgi:hypothetical protein